MYKYKAKIMRVIDGDTVDALIDLGFEVKLRKRFDFGASTPLKRAKVLKSQQLKLKKDLKSS